jgi:hypothetical protein
VIDHEEGGARDAHDRMTARAFRVQRAAADPLEIGQRRVAVGTWTEPCVCHGTLLHRAGAGARRGFLVAEGFVRALVDGGCGAGRSRGCGTGSRLDASTQPSLPSAIARTRYRAPAVRRGRHAVISTSTPSASVARVAVPSSPVTGTRPKPSPRLRTIARTPTARTVPFDGRDGSWENRRDAKPVGTGTDTSGKRPRSGANRTEAFPCGGEVAPDRATSPRPPYNLEPQYARPR